MVLTITLDLIDVTMWRLHELVPVVYRLIYSLENEPIFHLSVLIIGVFNLCCKRLEVNDLSGSDPKWPFKGITSLKFRFEYP